MTKKKSLDSGVLATFHTLSNNPVVGIPYQAFIKDLSTIGEAMDLVHKGYVEKVDYDRKEENRHYRLTEKGKEYLEKIVAFANKEF